MRNDDQRLHADVRSLVAPASLAIVGASARYPEAIRNNLATNSRFWNVNPRRDSVLGLPCFPTIGSLPEIPDSVLMLVGHTRLAHAVDEALAAGVRSFVV